MNSESMIQHLVCPQCGEKLNFGNEEITCTNCDYQSFYIDDIPWLLAEPRASLAEWQNRFSRHAQNLSAEISRIEDSMKVSDLSNLARKRLRELKKAKQRQNKALQELLQPLRLQPEAAKVLEAMRTVVPMSQRLMSYEANVFRDWAWGENENQVALELMKSVVDRAAVELSELLVVGAGASRLPVDLHQHYKLRQTLALDINPFLLMTAKKMVSGESLQLVDFPLSPKSREDMAVDCTLKSPYAPSEGFHFVFSDALELGLQPQSVSAVFTPWFIDIIPQDIDIFFRQLNQALQKGGVWLNFGSFAFFHREPEICYSKEEIFEVIETAGFEILSKEEKEIPYLQSPHSCQRRSETVLAFAARKVKDVDQYESESYLPEWISEPTTPVPSLDLFQSSVFINQIQFEVLRSVNGQNSIHQISKAVAEKYKMSPEQALQAVRSFFTKIYEENLFRSL